MNPVVHTLTLGPHGTKILGGLTTALTVLGAADPNALGSLFGVPGTVIAAVVSGLLTIVRGFGNSAAAANTAGK